MAEETPQAVELPGVVGPGVAPVSIPKINKLCDAYVRLRDNHSGATKELTEAKEDLIEEIHAHEEEIGKDSNGEIVYRYEDLVVTLKPGVEKLKVKNVGAAGEPNE